MNTIWFAISISIFFICFAAQFAKILVNKSSDGYSYNFINLYICGNILNLINIIITGLDLNITYFTIYVIILTLLTSIAVIYYKKSFTKSEIIFTLMIYNFIIAILLFTVYNTDKYINKLISDITVWIASVAFAASKVSQIIEIIKVKNIENISYIALGMFLIQDSSFLISILTDINDNILEYLPWIVGLSVSITLDVITLIVTFHYQYKSKTSMC